MSSSDCLKYVAYCLEMANAAKPEADRVKYLELAQAWLTEAISLSPLNERIERPGKSH